MSEVWKSKCIHPTGWKFLVTGGCSTEVGESRGAAIPFCARGSCSGQQVMRTTPHKPRFPWEHKARLPKAHPKAGNSQAWWVPVERCHQKINLTRNCSEFIPYLEDSGKWEIIWKKAEQIDDDNWLKQRWEWLKSPRWDHRPYCAINYKVHSI